MPDRVIFDLGANVGQNLPYYLLKADRVIAVEANPALAAQISTDYRTEIAGDRLVVVSSAIVADSQNALDTEFFVYSGENPTGHVLSSLVEPEPVRAGQFDRVRVPAISLATLFGTYGRPDFVKIDLERYDAVVLRDLLSSGMRPDYFSVEAHSPEILGMLLLDDDYSGFQVVRGKAVERQFSDHQILGRHGVVRYDFRRHSAGPFGKDLPGPWLDRSSLVSAMGRVGFGWVDIHASRIDAGGGLQWAWGTMSRRWESRHPFKQGSVSLRERFVNFLARSFVA